MQADSSLPSLPWVQSVCFIRWCNRLLNNRQTWYELSYLLLRGCTYGRIFLLFPLDFKSFTTTNMPLPSAGKAGARQAEKKTSGEFCKCIILLHLLHLVLETCEMQRDRNSGSPLPTRQSRVHFPYHGCLSPSLWRAPALGKTWQWRKTSDQSYQHLLFIVHFMYGVQFRFLRTLFYLKLCFLRTPRRTIRIKSAQFRLSVTC